MLLNFIASCLLSVGVATSSVRTNYDQQEVIDTPYQRFSINDVYGGYVFRNFDNVSEYFITDEFLAKYDNDEDIEIEIDIEAKGFTPVFATMTVNIDEYSSFQGTGGYDSFIAMINEFVPVSRFYIKWYGEYKNFDISLEYDDKLLGGSVNFYGNDDTTFSLLYSNNLRNNIDINLFALYFIDYVTFTEAQLDLFNCLFTADIQNNNYFVTYNGWYHFADNIPVFSQNVYLRLMGLNLYLNRLYNSLVLISNRTLVYTSFVEVDYYSSGNELIGESVSAYKGTNVNFTNVFMTRNFYNVLRNIGVFEYLPNVDDYGLDDLFVSIADTPIQFITGLFNFELFGTNFMVAFLSIVTVIAIIFIVRKVI